MEDGEVPERICLAIQNVLKSDLENVQICPIWGQLDQLWVQILQPWASPSQMNGMNSVCVVANCKPLYVSSLSSFL